MDIGKDLTKRQQEIFDFIKKYSAKYGYPPTVRDIGKAVGLASSSTVHAHLANLEKVGLLRRDPSKPRAIELLDRAVGARQGRRRAPAGSRSSAMSPRARRSSRRRTSRSTSRCPEIAGGDDGEYLLRIRGDSMINAGILQGDFVVVRPQDTAADGEIVVALVGEEATVKRFFREDDHVRLQPENDDARADPHARGAGARPRRRRAAEGRMSAVMTPRARAARPPRRGRPAPGGQSALFGARLGRAAPRRPRPRLAAPAPVAAAPRPRRPRDRHRLRARTATGRRWTTWSPALGRACWRARPPTASSAARRWRRATRPAPGSSAAAAAAAATSADVAPAAVGVAPPAGAL